jgi:hypothetical protein
MASCRRVFFRTGSERHKAPGSPMARSAKARTASMSISPLVASVSVTRAAVMSSSSFAAWAL